MRAGVPHGFAWPVWPGRGCRRSPRAWWTGTGACVIRSGPAQHSSAIPLRQGSWIVRWTEMNCACLSCSRALRISNSQVIIFVYFESPLASPGHTQCLPFRSWSYSTAEALFNCRQEHRLIAERAADRDVLSGPHTQPHQAAHPHQVRARPLCVCISSASRREAPSMHFSARTLARGGFAATWPRPVSD